MIIVLKFIAVGLLLSGLLFFAFMAYRAYDERRKVYKILSVLKENKRESLLENHDNDTSKPHDSLKWSLAKAGINKSDYDQIRYAAYGVMAVFILLPYSFVDISMSIGIALLGVAIGVFFPSMYLNSLKNERAQKMNQSLSTFLDLVIIILESGGGLNNALREVSARAKGILSDDLLTEVSILQSELGTYSSDVAYANLIRRSASKQLSTVVEFLKLADEMGIGVRTVFESQSKEIKELEFFEVEKKASVINLYLTMIVFIFIIPALGAFIVFPMMADALMPKAY